MKFRQYILRIKIICLRLGLDYDSELQYKTTNFLQGWCKQRMSLKQWENMCKKEKEKAKASLELAIASLWVLLCVLDRKQTQIKHKQADFMWFPKTGYVHGGSRLYIIGGMIQTLNSTQPNTTHKTQCITLTLGVSLKYALSHSHSCTCTLPLQCTHLHSLVSLS